LPEGTVFGFEMASFVINVQMYLPWCVWLAGDLHVLVFC
jgi:hypothetical protein